MSEEPSKVEEKRSNSPLKLFVKILPFLIVAAAFSVGSFYLIKQKPEVLGLSKGSQAVQAETDKLVSDVGKIIALPTDEKPTVATVTDAEKVKDQAFFKNAKNGDKVLIYQKAQKAILYRPSDNLIVEVGAVNINQAAPISPAPSASPSSSPQAK